MRTTIVSTAAALSAAALTVGLAGTAHAELYGLDDPLDTFHGSDIRSIQVKNGPENLHVVSQHEGLRRDPATGSSGVVFIDTEEADKGPEYAFVAGYFSGTDYQLIKTDGFARKKWGEPVEYGDYIMKVNYRKDRVHVTMSRRAIDDADDVRIAFRASGTRTDGTSHGLTDWVGEPRSFTPWIAQG
jgi:hypothetical protein